VSLSLLQKYQRWNELPMLFIVLSSGETFSGEGVGGFVVEDGAVFEDGAVVVSVAGVFVCAGDEGVDLSAAEGEAARVGPGGYVGLGFFGDGCGSGQGWGGGIVVGGGGFFRLGCGSDE
jgi:hypothetical protein